MSIIITGAAGQLGQCLQAILKNNALKLPVFAFDKQQLDIGNKKLVHNILKEYRPKWLINAAAFTAVDAAESKQEEAFNLNVNGPRYLAEECENIGAKLVHFSTDYVFSGEKTTPYVETDRCDPKSTYGETKWLGEQAILTTFNNYMIIRTSWVFSAYGHNFVKTILRLLREKDTLNIVADQHGCPTAALHLAKITAALLEKPNAQGIFHYCDAPATTWYDFAVYIQEQLIKNDDFHKKIIHPITTAEYPTPAIRPQYSVLNCEKIVKLLGFPQFNWQEGVKETLGALI